MSHQPKQPQSIAPSSSKPLRIEDILEMALNSPSVWSAPTVAEQPFVELVDWEVLAIRRPINAGGITAHLVGCSRIQGEGRVTTELVAFDASSRRVHTRSGRVYALVGAPRMGATALHVLSFWLEAQGAEVVGNLTGQFEGATS